MLLWKRIGLFFLFTLSACGSGSPRLQWPAQVTSIQGITDASLSDVTSQIEDLNTRLGSSMFAIGSSGNGSAITITKVSTFSDGMSSVGVSGEEFAYVALQTQNISARTGTPSSGTMIAGRATLSSGQCKVELASFLFEQTDKDLLTAVLWHELGHCGGLVHLTTAGELMSPMTLPFSKYSTEQLQRFFTAFLASVKQK